MPAGADFTESTTAADYLVARLQPRHGGRVRRELRLFAAVVAEVFQGLVPQPSLSDLVVTRRRDGVEVLRTPAGDAAAAADLLVYVRGQLAEQSVLQFQGSWSLPRDHGEGFTQASDGRC